MDLKRKGVYIEGSGKVKGGKLFSVHKWALKTRVHKSKSCWEMNIQGRRRDAGLGGKNLSGCEISQNCEIS